MGVNSAVKAQILAEEFHWELRRIFIFKTKKSKGFLMKRFLVSLCKYSWSL